MGCPYLRWQLEATENGQRTLPESPAEKFQNIYKRQPFLAGCREFFNCVLGRRLNTRTIFSSGFSARGINRPNVSPPQNPNQTFVHHAAIGEVVQLDSRAIELISILRTVNDQERLSEGNTILRGETRS